MLVGERGWEMWKGGESRPERKDVRSGEWRTVEAVEEWVIIVKWGD